MQRCKWVNLKNKKYVDYHDNEWGKLNTNDDYLYEIFLLEIFHTGLSWEIVLNKRENFKEAFSNFNIDEIALYDEVKVNELLLNKGIIRSKSKIMATINNAKVFKNIQKEFGSFNNYLTTFYNNKIIYENNLVKSPLSDQISSDLKKRGMKYVGSITMYAYLQAVGIINSHDKDCSYRGTL